MPRVTILTDFGTRDGYVGAMKGVISRIAPDAPIDDIAHDLPQGDVVAAIWALERYWSRYPEGTVHLIVVDPGVGTDRRPLAARVNRRFLVAPDNGVLTRIIRRSTKWTTVQIRERRYRGPGESATFHGRDIFAPAAAHLAAGVGLDALGPRVEDPLLLDTPEPDRAGSRASGEVVHVDRFGNAVTNVPGAWVEAGRSRVEVADRSLEVRETYGAVDPGEPLALVNSADLLEVAVRDGSAAETLGIGRGTPVTVEPSDASPEGC